MRASSSSLLQKDSGAGVLRNFIEKDYVLSGSLFKKSYRQSKNRIIKKSIEKLLILLLKTIIYQLFKKRLWRPTTLLKRNSWKLLWGSLFLNLAAGWTVAILLSRGSDTGSFPWILQNFKKHRFCKTSMESCRFV